jgi:predicted dehydrogenase
MARSFTKVCVSEKFSGIDRKTAPPDSLCIIASPPQFHRLLATQAFERGWHVLCEKPLASTSEDAAKMIEAAVREKRMLAVGHYKRFMPSHRVVKDLIARRTFGNLREIDIAEGGKFLWPAASDSFFRREQTPGGVLLDIGVHVLDLLLWWLGEPSSFEYWDDARDGLEANSLLTAEFRGPANLEQSPVRVRVRLSRDWETANCYIFKFESALVHSRVNASNRLELTFNDIPVTFAAELRDPLPARPSPPTLQLETNAQAFIAQIMDVCAAVRESRAPSVTGEDGASAIRWIQRCYSSRKPLAEPWSTISLA